MTLSMSAAPGPLTRRSSERELDGSKKRATSAGGINRAKQPGKLAVLFCCPWNRFICYLTHYLIILSVLFDIVYSTMCHIQTFS